MSHVNEGVSFKSIFYLVMIALYDKTAARRSHPAQHDETSDGPSTL